MSNSLPHFGPEGLVERLRTFGHAPALVDDDRQFSYAELVERIERWREELRKLGLQPGDGMALIGDYSFASASLLIAAGLEKLISIPLVRSEKTAEHERLLSIAGPRIVIRFDAEDRWTARELPPPAQRPPLLARLTEAGAPGLIFFTSGSTGESKGAVHDWNRFVDKFRRPRKAMRTLVFLLLDHLGGVNTLLSILSSGGTAISVRDRGPEAICSVIERHRIEILPTSPTLLNMILMSRVYAKRDLSSLKLITYGTEPMPTSTLSLLAEVFPSVQLKQTYGTTELGVLPTRSRDSQTLWMKVGGDGVETKIVDGTLRIRAEGAMLGYLNAPSPFDSDGWLDTRDAVEVDGEYLRILGRASDIINVGGQKVYPAEVESVLLQMDNVRDVTVRGHPNPVTGRVVAATLSLLEPEELESVRARMLAFCSDKLARFKIPMRVEIAMSPDAQHGARFKKLRPGS